MGRSLAHSRDSLGACAHDQPPSREQGLSTSSDETPEKSLLGSGLLISPTEPATDDANDGGSSSGGRGANTGGNNKSNPDSSHNMGQI